MHGHAGNCDCNLVIAGKPPVVVHADPTPSDLDMRNKRIWPGDHHTRRAGRPVLQDHGGLNRQLVTAVPGPLAVEEQIPGQLFDAARVDGAGPVRTPVRQPTTSKPEG